MRAASSFRAHGTVARGPRAYALRVEWTRGEYTVSTDPARIDLPTVHRFLSEEAYWSIGVPLGVVERAIAGSVVLGLYHGRDQVGLARVITDRATFAWVCDVFVLSAHRGQGLGKFLIECARAHPELQGLRRWVLATRDAHDLYEQLGFSLVEPGHYMEIRDPDVYNR